MSTSLPLSISVTCPGPPAPIVKLFSPRVTLPTGVTTAAVPQAKLSVSLPLSASARAEERCVGKEGVSTGRCRCTPYYKKKKNRQIIAVIDKHKITTLKYI